MAITSITIENFKGIGDAVTIPIRPITLLFGKNSSGKSTVLQALHYMREVCEHVGSDIDRTYIGGDYIDLGGFRSMVHLHELDRKIRIRIEFDLTSEESKKLNRHLEHVTNPDFAWIEVVTSWNTEEHSVHESFGYGLNGVEWVHVDLREKPEEKPSDTVDSNSVEWIRLDLREKPEEKPSDTVDSNGYVNVKHPDIKHPNIKHLVATNYFDKMDKARSILEDILLKELSNIRYLGPMRKTPSRDYRPQQTPDESLWAEGLEAWNILGRDPRLVKKINHYMRDILKLRYSIRRQEFISLDSDDEILKNIKKICDSENFNAEYLKKRVRNSLEQLRTQIRIKLHDEENDIDLDLIDVGLGITQVIPVLVGVLHSGRPDSEQFSFIKPSGGFFAVEQSRTPPSSCRSSCSR